MGRRCAPRNDNSLFRSSVRVFGDRGRGAAQPFVVQLLDVVVLCAQLREDAALANALTCAADGYPFPSNLDLDPNVGGLTPLSQIELLQRSLEEDWDVSRVYAELDAYAARHRTDEI